MKRIMNLLIPAALICAAWYGYSNWIAASADPSPPAAEKAFNCRQALARLAEEYACRDSAGCNLSNEDLTELRYLEGSIEQQCN